MCNRYDDSVEMEAQGLPEAIDKVIAVLRNDRYIFIEDMDVREIPLENDSGFHVRSIVTFPFSICVSAARLEHTPASLRYLLSLIPSAIIFPLLLFSYIVNTYLTF